MSDIKDVTSDFIADISACVILALSKSGKVLYYNSSAKYIFTDIKIGADINDIISPDDVVFWRHNMDIVFYTAEYLDFYWYFRKRFYQVSARLFNEKIFLCLRDITEIRLQHNLLSDCASRFSQTEKMAEIGYWELNLPQRKIYWSDGMYNLFGLNDDAKHGYNLLRRFIYPEDYAIYRHKLRELLTEGKNIHGKIRIIDAKNQIRYCRFIAVKSYFHGDEGACGIFQNIGSRIDDIQFFHNIKQHLQAIEIFADSLSSNKENITDQIIYHCKAVVAILNQIRGKEQKQVSDINKQLQEICMEFQRLAFVKGIKFICRLQPIEKNIADNELLLIVRNLLDNAFKFTSDKIILKNNADSIWIADNGCGIEKKSASDNANSGWGEGMNIINYNAARGNFKIISRSRSGQYTIFRVVF